MLRYISSIPTLVRVFIMNGRKLNFIKYFSYIFWDDHVVFVYVLLMLCITMIDLHMLNHPCELGMIPFGHRVWPLLFVVKFDLPILSWDFFFTYIHPRYWHIIFFFGGIFVWFWYQDGGNRMSLGVFPPLPSFARVWEGLV